MVRGISSACVRTIALSDLTPSVVTYIFSVSVSVFCGYPKSSISVGARQFHRVTAQPGRKLTVQQFIYKNKVVLDSLLIEFAKVGLAKIDKSVEEFENEGRIGIALGHGHQVYVLVLDMTEGCRSKRKNRRADLRIGDDLDPENVGQAWSAVISESAKDEVLAFLVEYKDSGEHVVDK